MTADQKKVFLSYRRQASGYEALNVYQHLTHEEYDVFMDVESLDSGRFPDLILHQIEARPHFLVVLVPGSLERTLQADDWLRQEIEHALRLDRNVVPLMLKNFSFEDEEKRLGGRQLPKTMKELSTRNAIPVYQEYFRDAMKRLTGRFISKEVVVKPAPVEDVPIIHRMDFNAKAAAKAVDEDWKAKYEAFTSGLAGHRLGKITRRFPSAFLAPVLEWTGTGCKWTSVAGALGYVLEMSTDRSFSKTVEVYKGVKTEVPGIALAAASLQLPDVRAFTPRYYRVKATSLLADDSPWSNVVEDRVFR